MSAAATAHFYWIQGDEHVLISQAYERVRNRYPEASARAVHIDSTVSWPTLAQELASADLFSGQCLWHIDFFDTTPDARALEFTRRLAGDTLDIKQRSAEPALIIVYTSAILKSAQRKSKWYTGLSSAAGIEIQWPMSRAQALSWARRQMDVHRIRLDNDALTYLMEKTEANLSLLDKEMHKLSLAAHESDGGDAVHFNLEQVRENVEGDHSRINPFSIATTALLDPIDKLIRVIGHLESEGGEINQLLGAMRFSLGQIVALSSKMRGGRTPDEHMRHLPGAQKNLIGMCLQRYNGTCLTALLLDLSEAEKTARGISPGNAWDALRAWARRVHRVRARLGV